MTFVMLPIVLAVLVAGVVVVSTVLLLVFLSFNRAVAMGIGRLRRRRSTQEEPPEPKLEGFF